jgi:hypothetical protein
VIAIAAPLLLSAAYGAAAAAAAGAEGDTGVQLAIAAILVVAAVALLTLEFIIATGGALAIAASLTAVAAVILAFMASTTTGVVVLAAIPVVGALVVHWGLRRLVRTRAVPRAEIVEDAGYHHLADSLGVAIGASGELVTDARPSGRARFATKRGAIEIDVRVQGAVLNRGQRVVVTALHGASVSVSAAPSSAP